MQYWANVINEIIIISAVSPRFNPLHEAIHALASLSYKRICWSANHFFPQILSLNPSHPLSYDSEKRGSFSFSPESPHLVFNIQSRDSGSISHWIYFYIFLIYIHYQTIKKLVSFHNFFIFTYVQLFALWKCRCE